MSYSRRQQNAEGRRGRLTNSIAASIMRDRASTNVVWNEIGEGVHPSLTSTDSKMLIVNDVDKDCNSDTRATNLYIQRSNATSEKGLGGIDRFIEGNQDIMASTSEWREGPALIRGHPGHNQLPPAAYGRGAPIRIVGGDRNRADRTTLPRTENDFGG